MKDYDIWVDFNDINKNGSTTTLAEFYEASVPLVAGLNLLAGDEDGNTCEAIVEVVQGKTVGLQLRLDTFKATR